MACSKNDNISHVGGGVSDDSDDEIPAIVAKKTSKSVPVTSSAKQSASGAKGKAAVACSKIDNPSHVGGGVIFDSDDEIPTKVAKRISTSVPATSSAKQSASGGKGKAAVACSKSDNISHVGGGVSDDSDDEIPTKVAKKPTKSIRVAGSMKLSTSCAKVGSITGAVSTVKHCKRRWSSGDLDLLLKTFGKDITCKRMPPTAQLISFMSLLSEPRSLAQVRAHVHNYISGKISHF